MSRSSKAYPIKTTSAACLTRRSDASQFLQTLPPEPLCRCDPSPPLIRLRPRREPAMQPAAVLSGLYSHLAFPARSRRCGARRPRSMPHCLPGTMEPLGSHLRAAPAIVAGCGLACEIPPLAGTDYEAVSVPVSPCLRRYPRSGRRSGSEDLPPCLCGPPLFSDTLAEDASDDVCMAHRLRSPIPTFLNLELRPHDALKRLRVLLR